MSQGHTPQTARSVRCQSCGGSIPVATVTPNVTCPYCHQMQALDAQLIQELSNYQTSAEAHLENAEQQLEGARLLQKATGREGVSGTKNIVVALLLMLVLPTIGFFVSRLLVDPSSGSNIVVPVAMIGTFALGFAAYLLWFYRGKREISAFTEGVESQVSCPNCGAINSFEMGQIVESCSHCQGALFPTGPVIEAGLAEAHQRERAAQLEQFRLQRSVLMQSSTTSDWGNLVVLGGIAGLFFGGSIYTTVLMVGNGSPLGWDFFSAWVFTFALVGALLFFILRRKMRKQQFTALMEASAEPLNGDFFPGIEPVVDWLDRFWPGPFPNDALSQHERIGSVSATVSQYPLLLFADLEKSNRYRSSRLEILLSAWVPGVSDGSGQAPHLNPRAQELKTALESKKIHVELNQAGLSAQILEETEGELASSPAKYLARVPEAISGLTRMSAALGATPGRTDDSQGQRWL